jgi:hypothetical protein
MLNIHIERAPLMCPGSAVFLQFIGTRDIRLIVRLTG